MSAKTSFPSSSISSSCSSSFLTSATASSLHLVRFVVYVVAALIGFGIIGGPTTTGGGEHTHALLDPDHPDHVHVHAVRKRQPIAALVRRRGSGGSSSSSSNRRNGIIMIQSAPTTLTGINNNIQNQIRDTSASAVHTIPIPLSHHSRRLQQQQQTRQEKEEEKEKKEKEDQDKYKEDKKKDNSASEPPPTIPFDTTTTVTTTDNDSDIRSSNTSTSSGNGNTNYTSHSYNAAILVIAIVGSILVVASALGIGLRLIIQRQTQQEEGDEFAKRSRFPSLRDHEDEDDPQDQTKIMNSTDDSASRLSATTETMENSVEPPQEPQRQQQPRHSISYTHNPKNERNTVESVKDDDMYIPMVPTTTTTIPSPPPPQDEPMKEHSRRLPLRNSNYNNNDTENDIHSSFEVNVIHSINSFDSYLTFDTASVFAVPPPPPPPPPHDNVHNGNDDDSKDPEMGRGEGAETPPSPQPKPFTPQRSTIRTISSNSNAFYRDRGDHGATIPERSSHHHYHYSHRSSKATALLVAREKNTPSSSHVVYRPQRRRPLGVRSGQHSQPLAATTTATTTTTPGVSVRRIGGVRDSTLPKNPKVEEDPHTHYDRESVGISRTYSNPQQLFIEESISF